MQVIESANWTRKNASIFDVSHMASVTLQVRLALSSDRTLAQQSAIQRALHGVTSVSSLLDDHTFAICISAPARGRLDLRCVTQGKDAVRFLEGLVVGDIESLADNTGTLTLMCNEKGGIIDDSVVTKIRKDLVYMVCNAGCRDKDIEHLNDQLKAFDGECKMKVHDDRSLIALQGPKAAENLQKLVQDDLSKVYFGNFLYGISIGGVQDCWATRTGCAPALTHSGDVHCATLLSSGSACAAATTACALLHEAGARLVQSLVRALKPFPPPSSQAIRRGGRALQGARMRSNCRIEQGRRCKASAVLHAQVHWRGRLRAEHPVGRRGGGGEEADGKRRRAAGGPGRARLAPLGSGPVPLRCAACALCMPTWGHNCRACVALPLDA